MTGLIPCFFRCGGRSRGGSMGGEAGSVWWQTFGEFGGVGRLVQGLYSRRLAFQTQLPSIDRDPQSDKNPRKAQKTKQQP